MAKMVWAENPTLPEGRPQQFTEARFKIYKTNGWVEVNPPDVNPSTKEPAEALVERLPSDKKPASETMIERLPSDKKPGSLQTVMQEAPVKKTVKPSSTKKKTTTKSSTGKK